jgi:hypothetical protein
MSGKWAERIAKWKVRRRAFHLWQRRPHEVAAMTSEEHVCASCGTRFEGNYCPRCGQSPRIGRFSFKAAFQLFIDVWGLGNRGMFRSLRDLLLRPGYMIRDYLSGMQSAYFPPFKMFFLLTTFSLIVTHVFQPEEQESQSVQIETVQKQPEQEAADSQVVIRRQRANQIIDKVLNYKDSYPSIFSFLLLLLFAVLIYFFFRHSPAIPDLRLAELVVAFTYVANMATVYSIIGTVLGLTSLFDILSLCAIFVAMRQLTGFRYRRLVPIALVGVILLFLVFSAAILAVMYI